MSYMNPFAMQPRRIFYHFGLTEIVVTPFLNHDLCLPPVDEKAEKTNALAVVADDFAPLHVCVIRFDKWEREDSWLASFPAAVSGVVIGTTEDYAGDNPEIARLMLGALKNIELVEGSYLVPIDLYVVFAHPDMTLCRHFTQAALGKPVIVIEAPQTQTALTVAGQVRLSSHEVKPSAQHPKQMGIDAQWLALAGLLGPLYFDGLVGIDYRDFKFALGLNDVDAVRAGGFVQLQNSCFDALASEFDALLASVSIKKSHSASAEQLGDQSVAEIETNQVAAPASRIKVWFHFCPSRGGTSQVNYEALCAIAEKYSGNRIGGIKAQSTLETAHQLNLVWTCAADINA